MPQRNGTGPRGMGPGTGRGLGPCGGGRCGSGWGGSWCGGCGRFGAPCPCCGRAWTKEEEREILDGDIRNLEETIAELKKRRTDLGAK